MRKNLASTHRDILLGETSSQKVCATRLCSGDQGGGQLSAARVTKFEMKLKNFKYVKKILSML